MSHEEADQDVADEVSEEVHSRGLIPTTKVNSAFHPHGGKSSTGLLGWD